MTEAAKNDVIVALKYTNWRGETSLRRIIPRSIRFGSTEWHPEPQWLLLAFDTEKRADREFALKDFGSPPPTVLDLEDMDMAAVGRSTMAAIETITSIDGPFKDWTPAEDPAEIITDLYEAVLSAQQASPATVATVQGDTERLRAGRAE